MKFLRPAIPSQTYVIFATSVQMHHTALIKALKWDS